MKNNVCFIGLGKLGLPLACVLASGNNNIFCLDKNEYILNLLNNGKIPFFEANLKELMDSVEENIVCYTDSYRKAVAATDAAIVLVNTQLGDDGYSSDFVESAVSDIAVNLKELEKDYYTIILSSTVLPGTIKNKLIPLVEKISGRKCGVGFGFAYVPDFVKLGSVINDFKNPEFFLAGAATERDFLTTEKIFEGVHENNCSHHRLTLEEAEVAKVALNAYIVNKITFANFLGMLCEDLDNVSVHNITKVIGIDKRISPHFFSSGTPYGGTCFPRDTWAFIRFAKNVGMSAKNLIFAEEVNQNLYNLLFKKLEKYKKVGVLGVSFKPSSPVTIGSPSAELIRRLSDNGGIEVFGYDKIEETFSNLDEDVVVCKNAQECIDSSDAIVIMHPDQDFSNLNYVNKKVVDPWGLLE